MEYSSRKNSFGDVGDNEHVPSKRIKRMNGGQMDAGKPQFFQKKQLEGSQEKNSTEACVVCNGGRQLVCCVNTCRVAVCASCLGFPPVFDDTGNFYWPTCSYCQAVATYREISATYYEIKQKMIKAKETSEQAKDRWKKFIKLSHGSKEKQAHELPPVEEVNQSEMVGDEVSAKGEHNDIADNQVTHSGLCQREAELEISSNGKQKERADNQVVLSGACPREGEHPPICSKILHSSPSQISDDLASIPKESSESPSVDDQQHADLGTKNDHQVAVNAEGQQMDASSPGRNSIRSDENVNEVSEYDSDDGCYDLRRGQIPLERWKCLT